MGVMVRDYEDRGTFNSDVRILIAEQQSLRTNRVIKSVRGVHV